MLRENVTLPVFVLSVESPKEGFKIDDNSVVSIEVTQNQGYAFDRLVLTLHAHGLRKKSSFGFKRFNYGHLWQEEFRYAWIKVELGYIGNRKLIGLFAIEKVTWSGGGDQTTLCVIEGINTNLDSEFHSDRDRIYEQNSMVELKNIISEISKAEEELEKLQGEMSEETNEAKIEKKRTEIQKNKDKKREIQGDWNRTDLKNLIEEELLKKHDLELKNLKEQKGSKSDDRFLALKGPASDDFKEDAPMVPARTRLIHQQVSDYAYLKQLGSEPNAFIQLGYHNEKESNAKAVIFSTTNDSIEIKIKKYQVIDWSYYFDNNTDYSTITAKWHDTTAGRTKKIVWWVATDSTDPPKESEYSDPPSNIPKGGGTINLNLHEVFGSEFSAIRALKVKRFSLDLNKEWLKMTIVGNPDLKPPCFIKVDDLVDGFFVAKTKEKKADKFRLRTVVHLVDENGYICKIDAVPIYPKEDEKATKSQGTDTDSSS